MINRRMTDLHIMRGLGSDLHTAFKTSFSKAMRHLPIVLVLWSMSAMDGRADVTVSIGNVTAPEGTTSFDILVQIMGGDEVSDLAGVLFVEGGGSIVNGPPTMPEITAVSYGGSIWEGAPGGFTASLDTTFGDTTEIVGPNLNLDEVSETVAADGLLLTFTLDLTGRVAGESFSLSAGMPGLQETVLQSPTGVVPTTFVDGSITITPEPGSLILGILGLGFVLLNARRAI